MDNRQQVLSFIRLRGPTLPVHVSKHINTSILMASAVMSELVSRGELKISNLKVGGSPLYYIKGQEHQLQKFSDKLNAKDRQTYQLLSEKKILRDNELQPLQRVSLRQIKDFAIPLKVKIGDNTEIFWKWHMLSDSDAEALIKESLRAGRKLERELQQPAKQPEPEKVEEPIRQPIKSEPQEPSKPKPTQQKQREISKEQHKPAKRFVDTTSKDQFLKRVWNYFSKNRIEVLEQEVVRKGSEVDFVIRLPSAVGSLKYYCKAKSKQRSNDTDLAAALVQAQQKNLPVIYLTTGVLTKRAKEMLNKEFKAVVVKTID
ncbi:hypothetical protein KY320_02915 [Candidatus Woesearchaeota archaeon]|nr:hypothetical protein [Candidatus Woesearchaeota archaeon]